MHAYTRMEVPVDSVNLTVKGLSKEVMEWSGVNKCCVDKLLPCNGTRESHDATSTSLLTFTVVLMLLLGFFLLLSSFLRLFLGRQVLNLGLGGYNLYPKLRMMLRVTFVLVLPLLSSVLSQIKGAEGCMSKTSSGILLVLLWLLLVELIRKKVQVMDLPTDGSSFTRGIGRFTIMDYATEVGHLTWTGYLLYSNIKGHNALMNGIFIILWSISLVKVLQRALNTWMASRSWHTARNPLLIAGYMQHVMEEEHKKEQEHHRHSSSAGATASISASDVDTTSFNMKMCQFVVAMEHKLVPKEKRALCCIRGGSGDEKLDGINMNLAKTKEKKLYCIKGEGPDDQKHVGVYMDLKKKSPLVTVGKIWGLSEDPLFTDKKRRTYLEDLCLSFSLFKLLRRLFEHYPMVEVGSSMARRMMIQGLLNLQKEEGLVSDRPLRVLQLELDFLEAYYQASVPMVMSNPSLFFLNYAWSVLLVPIYLVALLATLIPTMDAGDLYNVVVGQGELYSKLPFFRVFITLALLATVIFIEASELFTSYILANWNTVWIVCSYVDPLQNKQWWHRKFFFYFVVFRFLVHRVLQFLAKILFRHGVDDINVNQVSIIESCFPIHLLYKQTRQGTLGTKAKVDIIQSMKKLINMETGHVRLQLPPFAPAAMFSDGSTSTGKTKSTTEIILVFHLATELYEVKYRKEKNGLHEGNEPKQKRTCYFRDVATTLSRYCMYLVERMPALLPDDETWVSERACEMRSCLARVLQQCGSGCMICTASHCCKHTMADTLTEEKSHLEDPCTFDAVELYGKIQRWDELACFWVNLLIYLAPSNNIQGHAKAVASTGGDLISYLWAFCTHAGITRLPLDTSDDHSV